MRWATHRVRHGNGLDFLQLSIDASVPGKVWSELRSAGIFFRASIWRLLRLGELVVLLLQRNDVRVRSAEL